MSNAEVIAVGSELLLAGRQDTNSVFLADALASAGIEVRYKSVVGDDASDVAEAVRIACRRADVVVTTGGLGPTVDDCTREGIARALGRRLRRDSVAESMIRRRLTQWGRAAGPEQLRQALIPSGAEALPNPLGSAPGFCLRRRRVFVAALPGVPSEAAQMLHEELLPRLSRAWPPRRRRTVIERRVVSTFGLVELEVQRRLKGLIPPGSGIGVGLLASPLGVAISLTLRQRATSIGAKLAPGSGKLDAAMRRVRRRLGSYVYAEGSDTMERVVGRLLSMKGQTLALAESCTGGLIGHRLTEISGSSAYFDRGVVTYSNLAKEELLAVPPSLLRRHGAVSAPVAAAMARGVRLRSGANVGLSVTGIAGPTGGTVLKPVGLVYVGLDSVSRPRVRLTREFRFHGDRHMIKLRASQAALDLLRLHLTGGLS